MNKTFNILFHLLKSRVNEETGEAPIYLRITINGARSELTTNRSVDPKKWNSKAGKVIGTNEVSREINSYLETIRNRVFEKHRNLVDKDADFTSNDLKNAILGIDTNSKSILELMEYHNKQMKSLIDKDYALATYKKYCTAMKHLKEFISKRYGIDDISVKKIDHQFVSEFDYFLRTSKSHSNNSTLKYMRNFKKIVRIAISNGWIEKDPFSNYKGKLELIEKPYLTPLELKLVSEKEISIPRIDRVRDVFVFCCYTGLAFIDVFNLSKKDIVMGIDGEEWIEISRTKTGIQCKVPILPKAKEILEKYKNDSEALSKGKLLPVMSNQKMNAYLKEIAAICGIEKELTTHCARRTMGTTIGLSNGLPMESIAKILGHSNTRITESIYAKLTDDKLSQDFAKLKLKLGEGS